MSKKAELPIQIEGILKEEEKARFRPAAQQKKCARAKEKLGLERKGTYSEQGGEGESP